MNAKLDDQMITLLNRKIYATVQALRAVRLQQYSVFWILVDEQQHVDDVNLLLQDIILYLNNNGIELFHPQEETLLALIEHQLNGFMKKLKDARPNSPEITLYSDDFTVETVAAFEQKYSLYFWNED